MRLARGGLQRGGVGQGEQVVGLRIGGGVLIAVEKRSQDFFAGGAVDLARADHVAERRQVLRGDGQRLRAALPGYARYPAA